MANKLFTLNGAPSRRTVLKTGLGGLAGFALTGLSGCSEGGVQLETTPLSERLSLIPDAGCNVLAFAADEGLVLVDSGVPERSRDLLATLRALPAAGRVQTLINTHYHLEHTGGNAVLGEEGAAIVAHTRTKLRMATPLWRPELEAYQPAQPEAAWPTETFHTRGELAAADEKIEYGYLLHAHTDGDIYVRFHAANVIAVGNVVAPVRDPEFDWFTGGWLGGRIDALAQLLAIADADTRIVPGFGPLVTRAELEAEHAMLSTIHERAIVLLRKGRSAKDMLAEGVLDDLGRTFQDPDKLLYDIYKGFWGHHSSMSPDIV